MVIARRLSDIVRELDVAVHTLSSYPDMNNRYELSSWCVCACVRACACVCVCVCVCVRAHGFVTLPLSVYSV